MPPLRSLCSARAETGGINRACRRKSISAASEYNTLNGNVRRGLSTSDSAKTINDWDARGIRPLDQVATLNKAFPGTDRIYIREFQFLAGQQRNELGRIKAIGYAKDRPDVEALKQQLADMNYVVKPTTEKRSTHDPDYPLQFELDLQYVKASKPSAKR